MPEITETPGVQGGEPCIAGTRTPVRTVAILFHQVYQGQLSSVHAALPHLTVTQLNAALRYYLRHKEKIDEIIRLNDEAGEALRQRAPRASAAAGGEE